MKTRLLKICRAVTGLVICAFGTAVELTANIGMSPWEALNQGIGHTFGMSYGDAGLMVAVLVFALDVLLKERIGLGTLLDVLMVTECADFFSRIGIIPIPENIVLRLLMFLAGIAVLCFGQFFYISAGLCCGPRDSLMVAVGRRVRRVPIGAVNMGIQTVVLVTAVLLGCPVGIGTVAGIVCVGPIMQLVFHLVRFEPRDVEHESFAELFRSLRKTRSHK